MAGRKRPSTSPLIAQVLAALQHSYPQLRGVTVDDSGGDLTLNQAGAAGLSYRPGESPFVDPTQYGFITMQTGKSLGANQGLKDPSALQLAVLKHELGHQMEPFLLGGGNPDNPREYDAHVSRVKADKFLDISGIGRANNILQQTIQGRTEARSRAMPRDRWGLPSEPIQLGYNAASPLEQYANLSGLQFGGAPWAPNRQWGLSNGGIDMRRISALVGAGLLPKPYDMPKGDIANGA